MIADLWKDGVIDCKDYALYNASLLKGRNIQYEYILTPKDKPKHIFVIFKHGGNTYALDNDKLFIVGGELLSGR